MILGAGGNPFITYVPTLTHEVPSRATAAPEPLFLALPRGHPQEPAQNTKSATSVIFVMGGVAS